MPEQQAIGKPADAQAEKPAMLATSGPLSSTAPTMSPPLQACNKHFIGKELVKIGKMVNPYKKDNDSNASNDTLQCARHEHERITPPGRQGPA
jgi:hypothetical protein